MNVKTRKRRTVVIILIALAILSAALLIVRDRYNSGVEITMERSACEGTCPVYTLSITGDGEVIYEGEDYVNKEGVYTSEISQNDVEKLVNEFHEVGYFSLNDSYGEIDRCIDFPSTTTSFRVGNSFKEIYNLCDGPDELNRLEDMIDKAVNSSQWID